jgi:peptidoglycan/xylan/chitin deacetylase (PgdA/CDA1 family)
MAAKTIAMRLGLNALYYSSIYRLFEPRWAGVGAIFTLHHVVAPATASSQTFAPNRILDISPDFLDQTIRQVRAHGLDIVSLDEARRRLVAKDFAHRFVCFTLDDGYQDNLSTAYPIFKKHEAPFTVYVTTGIADRTAVLWWVHLEEVIKSQKHIDVKLANRSFTYQTKTSKEKYRAFEGIYWFMRSLPQAEQQEAINTLLKVYALDARKLCEQCGMSWDQLRELANEKLVTIGAHTVQHHVLSRLTPDDVRHEARGSRDRIAAELGRVPEHFTYPYGDHTSAGAREFSIMDELGFSTSTTTRKGLIFPEHAHHLQALPRVSLNGDYQNSRYVRLYLGGAPFALWNRFKRLDVK